MAHELEYFCSKVWELTSEEEARKDPAAIITGGRWVNRNKGDNKTPKVRCRYVATEVNTESNMDFYAATPPLEAKRMLFSMFAQQGMDRSKRKKKLLFIDITKAYFNAAPTRSIFVKVPRELGLPKGTVGRLTRCCYGTRDAGMLWEETYAEVLEQACFVRGKACPRVFYPPERDVAVVCHGDDVSAVGREPDLLWYKQVLAHAFEI